MSVQGANPKSQDEAAFSSLGALRSAKSTQRLNQIAHVRAKGVGEHISLPQIAVCGDQSAGKSSVLEGITGIPFPRKDGVCTKFATEITLYHSTETSSIIATMIPHISRSKPDRERLQAYHRVLTDFFDLPSVIHDASCLLQLRGFGTDEGLAFSEDVLRIEVIGDTGLNLTVVDLPGLIAVPNEEQTEEDVQLVERLVDSYLQSSRTIILAVIQASNDIANQGIIRRARKFDKAGQRTVGIITKPDLINKSTEGRIALLAKNQDTTKLKLGYFLLKNPDPEQLDEGISLRERKQKELEFFSSAAWTEHRLDPARVGIDALREFLQDLLDRHIERELPKVRNEIKTLLAATEAELANFGDERPTPTHMRMFLTRRSMEYYNLARAALEGNYYAQDTDFFGLEGYSMRLRAEVHKLNGLFATHMRETGSKRKIVGIQLGDTSDEENESVSDDGQLLVTKREFDLWVNETYIRTRGRELPGNYNHILLAELFHEHSDRWSDIADRHLTQLFQVTSNFVEKALTKVFLEDDARQEILLIARNKLEEAWKLANDELQKILADEKRQPITYNHYYTDNIQNAREDSLKKAMQAAVRGAVEEDFKGKFHISNTAVDSERLLNSLQRRLIVNMDAQACAEAVGGLNAYYKVAMKTFVDNICRQVIERHLLSNIPDIFAPTTAMAFSDEDLIRIAAEPAKQKEKRTTLAALAQGLRDSLIALQN
ncbi:putative dynamin GTPase [Mollisia scopiformis]|uniref:Putative dynamin GTPase n=1 Tax=Mollisia scopiformis TaxID=149040 RepID=A0A194X9L2_MOLSC|nr:putative dynamin GTPase [Mollisia scopiformis]KUJ16853.1 putative dynamin GTPase [Mollisia scopiformis]